jgi:hypothetical protein
MSLVLALQTFRDVVTEVNGLIAAAHTISAAGAPLWSAPQTQFITESAFLKMFIAWESFLEKSFLLYLMGNNSVTGNVIVKFATPVSEDHANKMLIGTMKYVDWSTPETVKKFANIYFDNGEPYETVISSIHGHLADLKIIRNASAHLSSTTSANLDRLATRLLGVPSVGISVYTLILSNDPTLPPNTILQSYQSYLDSAAELISNA